MKFIAFAVRHHPDSQGCSARVEASASLYKVRSWAESLPGWLEIRDGAVVVHRALVELDPGEREAIQKALDLKAEVVLIDDLEGRMLAGKLGLEVRGTLGILERGARLGLSDFRQSLARLERTTFQMSPGTRADFLRRNP